MGTHAVVAAPSSLGVCSLHHLHGTVILQVAHVVQAAIVVHLAADAAGEEALGCPHLTDLTHLIVEYQRSDDRLRLSTLLREAVWVLPNMGVPHHRWGWV